ncbi:MAG: hypothetical protein J2P17_14555 [Mycobacterium sp.]|nr:hypothetical protein [Mycobacterium sp.]
MSAKSKKNSKVVSESSLTPRAEKRAVSSPPGPDKFIRFRFGRLDHGKWALCKIDRQHHKRLLERLAYFEQMTVAQAKSNDVLADYDMSECTNQSAKRRLSSRYSGQDSLSRLTVDPHGKLRLLGIREDHEFHIVWWDPNHEIWPDKNVR